MTRIIYVCPFTGRGGGPRVIARHVQGLAARGHAAEWWGLEPDPSWWAGPTPYRRFASTDELGRALYAETPAVKVATWWQTASWIQPSLRTGDLGAHLVQDDDAVTYAGVHDGACYRLGLRLVTESEWVTNAIRTRYGLEAVNVGIGVDRFFQPLPIERQRYRVLTQYRPGTRHLKGWPLAHETMLRLREFIPQASLVTFGSQGRPRPIRDYPHIHIENPTDKKVRELYCEAGVYLSTSRHEGFGLPIAEAMACETPVVCTDAHGNMEFCRHDETALVGASPIGIARHIANVMTHPYEAAARAMYAADKVMKRYRWEDVIERVERLYRGACDADR